MELLAELFSDWVGILSFGVVAFVIVMAVYMFRWVGKHVAEDAKKAG
ncbi:MAG: DUF3149 domain-containing protein [Pseudomonadales bacterium]|jgi:hypothetical protein